MNKKGIAVYLLVTFGLGWVLSLVFWKAHLIDLESPTLVHNVMFVLLLWVPAAGAAATRLLAPEDAPTFTLWPVPWGAALRVGIFVVLAYACVYILPALIGWSDPQWGMGTLVNRLEEQMPFAMTPEARRIAPVAALVLFPVLGLALGMTVYAALALGNELGWRGTLLPRLLARGWNPTLASAVTGLLWGLWFLPLIYAWYAQQNSLGDMFGFAVRFVLLATALGTLLGRVFHAGNHLGLCAIIAGCWAAQLQGGWSYLFPMGKTGWTGAFGIVAIAVWILAALLVPRVLGRESRETAESDAQPDSPGA